MSYLSTELTNTKAKLQRKIADLVYDIVLAEDAGCSTIELHNQVNDLSALIISIDNSDLMTAEQRQEILDCANNKGSVSGDSPGNFRPTGSFTLITPTTSLVIVQPDGTGTFSELNIYEDDSFLTADRTMEGDGKFLKLGTASSRLNNFNVNTEGDWTFNARLDDGDIWGARLYTDISGGASYWEASLDGYSTSTIVLNPDDFIIGSSVANFKGATYAADYSADFVNETLVTKRYVDALVAANNEWEEILANGNISGQNDAWMSRTSLTTAANAGLQVGSQKIRFENALYDGAEQLRYFELYSLADTSNQEETTLKIDYNGASILNIDEDRNVLWYNNNGQASLYHKIENPTLGGYAAIGRSSLGASGFFSPKLEFEQAGVGTASTYGYGGFLIGRIAVADDQNNGINESGALVFVARRDDDTIIQSNNIAVFRNHLTPSISMPHDGSLVFHTALTNDNAEDTMLAVDSNGLVITRSAASLVAAYLPLAGGTMTGDINMDDNKVLFGSNPDDGFIWIDGVTNELSIVEEGGAGVRVKTDGPFTVDNPGSSELFAYQNDTISIGSGGNMGSVDISLITADRTYNLPDQSGTIALTSSTAKKIVATAQSTNYNAADGDFVLMTAGATDKTVTLPAAASNTDAIIEVKKVDSGAGNVIIDGNLAETIDGALTQTILSQYTNLTLHCDGSNWHIK